MADLIFMYFSRKPYKFKYFSSLCEPWDYNVQYCLISGIHNVGLSHIFTEDLHISLPKIFTYLYQRSSHIFTEDLHISLPKIFTYLYQRSSHIFTEDLHISLPKIFTYLYQRSSHIFTEDLHISLPKIFTHLYRRSVETTRHLTTGDNSFKKIKYLKMHVIVENLPVARKDNLILGEEAPCLLYQINDVCGPMYTPM